MKKLFRNVKFFLIWGVNSLYSVKDLRLSTPVSLPAVLFILGSWFILLTYFLLF
jgi:hypothetical protein